MKSLKTKNPSVTTVASTTIAVFDFLNKKIHSFNMAITTDNLNI